MSMSQLHGWRSIFICLSQRQVVPLLVMALGFMLLFVTLLIVRMGTELNERKSRALRLNSMRARPSADAAGGPFPASPAALR